MTVFLGIDVGTQGLKAILLEPGRSVIASASSPLRTLPGLPAGFSEQHPADWLDALRSATLELRSTAAAAFARVAAIGVSGQQHGLVAVDAADRVIRPAMLWNDVRCAIECGEIVAALGGPDAAFRRTGLAALPPGFTAGKLRWLFRHERAQFDRMTRVFLPHDYVNWWLTGAFVAEAGDASGTGLLDVRRRRYDEATCEAVAPGLGGRLAPIQPPGAIAGRLRDEVAAELGLPRSTIVALGGGDNMMAAIGAGAIEAGVAVMSLGTSGTIFACSDVPICDPKGELAPFCDSTGGWLPLGCTMNATVATETVRALLGSELTRFDDDACRAPAGADGVLCVPYFTGERSPDLPSATGALLGLTPRNTTPPNFARAAMEGATFGLVRLLDRLRELGLPLRELRVTGGGSRSATWCDIVGATCGVPVRIGTHADAAAIGAAVQAAWTWHREHGEAALGIADCRARFALDAELVQLEPAIDDSSKYAELRKRWQTAVDALTPCFPTLQA